MDNKELYIFYGTLKGRVVRRILRKCITKHWDKVKNQDTVIAFGYGTPYLESFLEKTKYCFDFMPESMGADPWPFFPSVHQKKNSGKKYNSSSVALIDSSQWPLADNTISHLLMVHGLEFIQDADNCLQEAWRTLKASGELLLIMPNKYGPWANTENTPFGGSLLYSYPSIYQLLDDNGFEIIETEGLVHFWPLSIIKNIKIALSFDSFNKKFLKWWPGVWVLKVRKKTIQPLMLRVEKSLVSSNF